MEEQRRLTTREKALKINLDGRIYGSFAEIGAGQETAGNFFKAGGASGTVAKTMSAYDMSFSDAIYGEADRYVSESRLLRMLEKEYGLLEKRLDKRKDSTCFFAFANTVETTNFHRTNEGHGWVGLRFQLHPNAPVNECIIHLVLNDKEAYWQQRAIGIIGVNLLYGCFRLYDDPEYLIRTLLDNVVTGTVEIDMFRLSGPDFQHVDNRLMSLKLVKNGLTKAAMFGPDGSVLQPSEALYKKNALVMSGRFRPFTKVHEDMLEKATRAFSKEEKVDPARTVIISELSLNALIDTNGNIDDEDFLDRVNILCSLGHTVMITNFLDYWYLMPYLTRATRNNLVGFVLSARNVERIFDPLQYTSLRGGLLEALTMLFGGNTKAYSYPAYRSGTDELIRVENLQVNPEIKSLVRYFIEAGKLADIGNPELNYLNIDADEVLMQIKAAEPEWEQSVPEKVAQLIKDNCLFDYPCDPGKLQDLEKKF